MHPASLPSSPENDHLRTQVFLGAILPALVTLLREDSRARKAIGRQEFSVAAGVANTLPFLQLQLSATAPACHHLDAVDANLILTFRSERAAALFAQDRSSRLPVSKGWGQPRRLFTFLRLALRLKSLLKPNLRQSLSPEDLITHLQLSFAVLQQGLPLLARHDVITQKVLQSLPPGTIVLAVKHSPVAIAFALTGSALDPLPAIPPCPAVRIEFADAAKASAVLLNQIDSHAALCLGHLRVSGLIPLAEGVGTAMDRFNQLIA